VACGELVESVEVAVDDAVASIAVLPPVEASTFTILVVVALFVVEAEISRGSDTTGSVVVAENTSGVDVSGVVSVSVSVGVSLSFEESVGEEFSDTIAELSEETSELAVDVSVVGATDSSAKAYGDCKTIIENIKIPTLIFLNIFFMNIYKIIFNPRIGLHVCLRKALSEDGTSVPS
jgi:hypothetical protein